MRGISALILIELITNAVSKLVFAFEMCRHGARAPTMLYSNNTDYFGQKWAKKMELTSIGLRQHYLVGVRNRERLIEQGKLLSDTYDPKELKILSTDTSRTLSSANAQLNGLYPPGKGGRLINDEQIKRGVPPNDIAAYKEEMELLKDLALPNQIEVIPIFTIYPQDNNFFLYSPTYCPTLKDIFEANNNRPELLALLDQINEKHQKGICTVLKLDPNCIGHNITFAINLFETIHAEYVDDRDMKPFSDVGLNVKEMVDDCVKFAALHLIGSGIDNDKKIGQVGMSPTFRKLFEYMKRIIDNTSPVASYSRPKFVMISAHDASIGAFEAVLKAALDFKIKFSSFASNLFLELHVNEVESPTLDDYTVKYIFDDEELGSVPYMTFVNKVAAVLMTTEEIDIYCKIEKKEKTNALWLALTAVFGVINVVIIGFMIHVCLNKPKMPS